MGVIIISVLYLISGLVLAIQSTYNATIEDDSSSYIVNTEIKILDSNLESVRTFLKLVGVHKAVKTSGECCQVVAEGFRLQLHCFWRRRRRYR